MLLPYGNIFQAAWHVSDLDAAMRRWHEVNGAGPFYTIRNITVTADSFSYRGRPCSWVYSAAIAQSDALQIELVMQHNDGPSAYRDAYQPDEEGLHHMAMMVSDFDAAIARYCAQGYEIAQRGHSLGMGFCYIDTRRTFGYMIEILENYAPARAAAAKISSIAATWDGTNPYRSFTDSFAS